MLKLFSYNNGVVEGIKPGYSSNSGFTLIEISAVLIIIGLLMVGFVRMAELYQMERRSAQMDETFDTVRAALADYIQEEAVPGDVANYPCPAPPTAVSGDANFGKEQRTGTSCAAGNGVLEVNGATGTQKVYIGAVPTQTLGIASYNMLDPYKNQLTYAVSADVAETDALVGGAEPPGNIKIHDHSTSSTTTEAAFALFSHGKNGLGAYTSAGVKTPGNCNGSTGDRENCDGDSTFITREYSTAGNVNDYDDRFEFTFVEDDDNGWWVATDATNKHIMNRNDENVGVGTSTPSTKFEVEGDSKTDKIYLDEIVVEGEACPEIGYVGTDANGIVLSCQEYVWKKQIINVKEELGAIVGCRAANEYCKNLDGAPPNTVLDTSREVTDGAYMWDTTIGPRTFCSLGFMGINVRDTLTGEINYCRVKPVGIDPVTGKPIWHIRVGSGGKVGVGCHAVCIE